MGRSISGSYHIMDPEEKYHYLQNATAPRGIIPWTLVLDQTADRKSSLWCRGYIPVVGTDRLLSTPRELISDMRWLIQGIALAQCTSRPVTQRLCQLRLVAPLTTFLLNFILVQGLNSNIIHPSWAHLRSPNSSPDVRVHRHSSPARSQY